MIERRELFSLIDELDFQAVEPGRFGGQIDFTRYQLSIPPDTTAGWTTIGIRLPQLAAAFPPELFDTPAKRTALEDAALRRMAEAAAAFPDFIRVPSPGNEILPRSAVNISPETAQASVTVNFGPSDTYSGDHLRVLFAEAIPRVINAGLVHCNHDERALNIAVASMQNIVQFRQSLASRGLVAFIGEGATVTRDDGEPLHLQFDSALATTLQASGLSLNGMGIPNGLTLIIGDRYSGRRELLESLAFGVYNRRHRQPGERVITTQDAVWVAAEPGRSIQSVDLRGFLRHRPGIHPERFSTTAADDFTSQAAATMEAIEAGSRLLLFEEGSSSAEFLGGSGGLLEQSSTIPLAAQVDALLQAGVSLVVAGSGTGLQALLPKATRVLRIESGYLSDITEATRGTGISAGAAPEISVQSLVGGSRWIVPYSIDPAWAESEASVSATHRELTFGGDVLDASGVRQLVDDDHLATIGYALGYARRRLLDDGHNVRSLLDAIDEALANKEGLAMVQHASAGRLARPRRYEVAAILNRLPSLRISSMG